MDTVEELVTLPFREVIEKGNLAIENAADHPVMMREAQRLVKMGERSLARIEASSQKLYNEYGINFLIALKENGMSSDTLSVLIMRWAHCSLPEYLIFLT